MPGKFDRRCEITHVYNREEAYSVIRRSIEDYRKKFGDVSDRLNRAFIEVIE